jgi:hypothetical protein
MAQGQGRSGRNGQSPQQQPRQGQQESGGRSPPAHEIRVGSVKATLWENSSDNGKWFSVTLTRGYKDGQGQWKTAQSFSRDDLLVLSEILRQAYLWIAQQSGAVGFSADSGGGQDDSEGRF